MISAEHLETAERILSATYNVQIGPSATQRLYNRADINAMAAERYLQHHKTLLFNRYIPDADPRHEPAIVTMLNHMLCVGVVAARLEMNNG